MFNGLKARLNDMATLRSLCEQAERQALLDQQTKPGAEQFLLAALDPKDGTARLAFEKAGADPAALRPAIARQYEDALHSIGIRLTGGTRPGTERRPLPAPAGIYDPAPSGQALMQELAASRKDHRPLLGAHVVAITAGMEHGVVARALRLMAVDPGILKSAAEVTIKGALSRAPG
ncbi:Clp protease N-terminal domain-containing protein [Rubellimicrobium rubrum]|uniref:Clp protease N-terminal domain-containing protein n=1 Tax=Rubellimicrobium rubrum TaxID=2585369 RepID=UPI00159B9820|nr:Clp protease N-terminal domain-containing protein [Rubellimicrobium rubrum]